MIRSMLLAVGLLTRFTAAQAATYGSDESPLFLTTGVFVHELTFDYDTDLLGDTKSEEIISPAIGLGLRINEQLSLVSEASLGRLEYMSYDYEDIYDFAKFNYDYGSLCVRAEWNLELAQGVAIAPTIGAGYTKADYKWIIDDLDIQEDDEGLILIGGVSLSFQIEENAWLQLGYRYQEFEFNSAQVYGPTDVEHQGYLINVNWEF